MKILVTGCAGFVGFHTSLNLLRRGDTVIGYDNLNDYYSVSLKKRRLEILKEESTKTGSFIFYEADLCDIHQLELCFKEQGIEKVINLAAQAGVRYSIESPRTYADSNIIGFLNILELCRDFSVQHLTYASTSSVYGSLTSLPFEEKRPADHPIQFYAATKRANELMAHSYSHLFGIPTTGLRFFTVYGPWGRPDMALFKFVKNILAGEKITIFNDGNHMRDFTYIDDIVDGVLKINDKPALPDSNWDTFNPDIDSSSAPYKIFNLGNGNSVNLLNFIEEIEKNLNKKAIKEFLPIQPGDVKDTLSDTSSIRSYIDYNPKVNYKEGIKKFIDWYLSYYQ